MDVVWWWCHRCRVPTICPLAGPAGSRLCPLCLGLVRKLPDPARAVRP